MSFRTLASLALLILFVVSLSACSELGRPISDQINKLPVVQVGHQKPPDDYVLYVPANTNLPVRLEVKGTLFEKDQAVVANTIVRKSFYIYREWASFDGHSWVIASNLLSSLVAVTLDSEGGKVEIRFDERK